MDKTIEDVTRNVSTEAKTELMIVSARRCQYMGCNKLLNISPLSKEKVNLAEKAHIYSFSEDGPRGHNTEKEDKVYLNNVENLMLLCHDCHKTIDSLPENYPAELLIEWKKKHEDRIRLVTDIQAEKASHVIFYCSNIGPNSSAFNMKDAICSLLYENYPAKEQPEILSMSWEGRDNEKDYYTTEEKNLIRKFEKQIIPLIEHDDVKRFSIFALAPIPLLIKLGTLFTDKLDVDVYQLEEEIIESENVDVYQLKREPRGWNWQEFPEGFEFIINEPEDFSKPPALVISISDKVKYSRLSEATNEEFSIWEITVNNPEKFRHNDTIRHPKQLMLFRKIVRKMFIKINDKHGLKAPLSIFPAMPISCSIEFGRVWMPKANNELVIYDEVRKDGKKCFKEALNIGGKKYEE